jgi:DNA-binding PadR family transcriptional regulator
MGKHRPGSLLIALERLQREGWLKSELRFAEQPDGEMVYSLTAVGKQRLAAELSRRGSMVTQFVEGGELDKSFRAFPDRRGFPYGG